MIGKLITMLDIKGQAYAHLLQYDDKRLLTNIKGKSRCSSL